MTPVQWAWSTPMQPGAIALVTLHGESAALDALLAACCRSVPAQGGTARCHFADPLGTIDDGVAVRASPTTAMLMPHGGVRIAQRLQTWLRSRGAIEAPLPDLALFPECDSPHAAAAARMAGRCASRRALELLRDHAARIERALASGDGAAALAQWERLPDAAKAASADWAKALRARTSAQEAARALLSDAMARLARSQS